MTIPEPIITSSAEISFGGTVVAMNTRTNEKRGGSLIPRLGIDIGRVIIDGTHHPYAGDTAFFDGDERALLATPEVDGAVESIARLVELFDGQVWLVSKCGQRVRERTLRWLNGHKFYRRTFLPRDHVRFCVARQDKRIHCVELGLTHFVDDRVDVHEAIRDVVGCRYLFGPQSGPVPRFVTPVRTWPVAERFITATLARGDWAVDTTRTAKGA
jgi:hypothetical protein